MGQDGDSHVRLGDLDPFSVGLGLWGKRLCLSAPFDPLIQLAGFRVLPGPAAAVTVETRLHLKLAETCGCIQQAVILTLSR